jgi:hypothetical protein
MLIVSKTKSPVRCINDEVGEHLHPGVNPDENVGVREFAAAASSTSIDVKRICAIPPLRIPTRPRC